MTEKRRDYSTNDVENHKLANHLGGKIDPYFTAKCVQTKYRSKCKK